ncbi:hypothetical protein OG800_07875 [Streptomyces sp. NBC_00445]|uniref:hypothetical protein n=1 Tax=Streptomyces sp. NBC_00445 TaxID=2975745 RepID=UPI002E237E0D
MTVDRPEELPLPAHRPLSDWIARVRPAEPGQLPALGRINDGDERADARTMLRFRTQSWTRTSQIVERGGAPCRALALRAPDGTEVVELDDFGVPIAVSETGTRLIALLEQHWALPPASPDIIVGLGEEDLVLRYFLLHRLSHEIAAPPHLFHCLPWERVDAAARSVTALLDAATDAPAAPRGPLSNTATRLAEPPSDAELRHWFTPAASLLAGPLQVLASGLRGRRTGPWFGRETASLLTGLLAAQPERLPRATRHVLAGLAEALGAADPALQHSARLAAVRMTGLQPIATVTLRQRLDSDFVLRASSGQQPSGHDEFLEQPPIAARLTMTRSGLLEIEMEIEDHATPSARRLTDGTLCYPVTLRPVIDTGETQSTRFWMVLNADAGTLHGFVAVTVPDVTFEVDLDAPPVPLRFLNRVPRSELEASLDANEHITLSWWHELIDDLPPHHPAHAALAAYTSRHT